MYNVSTQKQFDEIPLNAKGEICIANTTEAIAVCRVFSDAYITVSDNATIKSVSDNATIESVSDNATIKSVSDNATIKYVFGNATIKYVYGNATIKSVSDNATIEYVSDDATILLVCAFACVMFIYSAKHISARGHSVLRIFGKVETLEVSKTVTVLQQKPIDYSKKQFEAFSVMYPIQHTKTHATLYKAVHKIGEMYIADYDKKTNYVVGEVKEIKNDPSTSDSCSFGIHVAHKQWAITFGRGWGDMALLECEVAIKDIVVSSDCDGKVRAGKIKVLREVPKEEW